MVTIPFIPEFVVKQALKQFTSMGGTFFYATVIVGCLALGWIFPAIILSISLVLITAVVGIIKWMFWKKRPVEQKYKNVWEKIDAGSFPSAHAMRSTSLAFWAVIITRHPIFSLFAIALAVVIMATRVILKKHYVIDIIGGAIISFILNIAMLYGLILLDIPL